MTIETGTAAEKTTADDVRTEIIAVAAAITPEERKLVDDIIARAKTGERGCVFHKLTPPMEALIFLEHNSRNRDWRVDGTKSCLEYKRRMKGGLWKYNGIGIGFYVTGSLDDGQHRLSGAALAGYTLEVPISFGVELSAIDTVDEGISRHASDHAKLEGIADAKRKQTIVKDAGRYFNKAGVTTTELLLSEAEIKETIRRNDTVLADALAVGEGSVANISSPLLKDVQAATIAYVMLKSGWPVLTIKEKLALLQLRMNNDGGDSPFLIAANLIQHSRDRKAIGERLSTIKEIAVCIKAFQVTETGARGVQAKVIRDAVKSKRFPDPTYQGPLQAAA